ncbi:MAG: hypothetical protein CSA15_07165, partial [Candidatus Delongbacteria bacterium]
VQGVFTGPSEFHIFNTMKLCERANLPFYTTEDIWKICSDKRLFKNLCNQNNVPSVSEYIINGDQKGELLDKNDYPVIVKPVDCGSSIGISVCNSNKELEVAIDYALSFSKKKEVIVEKYIENRGLVTNIRYIALDGDIHLSLLGDQYIVDPVDRTALITGVTVFPSMHTKLYLKKNNAKVMEMFRNLGVKNGSFFMQALPYNNEILIHEMGMRISGGLIYKITEPLNNLNDFKLMLNYAMGEKIDSEEVINSIDIFLKGKTAIDLCIPLKHGVIKETHGIEKVKSEYDIVDFIQYYNIGDEIKKDYIGSLQQLFCRVKFIAENIDQAISIIEGIQNTISIIDSNNEDMIFMKFDVNRIKENRDLYNSLQ